MNVHLDSTGTQLNGAHLKYLANIILVGIPTRCRHAASAAMGEFVPNIHSAVYNPHPAVYLGPKQTVLPANGNASAANLPNPTSGSAAHRHRGGIALRW